MNTLNRFAGLAIVIMMSVGANALDGVQGADKDAVVEPEAAESTAPVSVLDKPVVGKKLGVAKPSANQILCVRQRREGSRVRETKCQTLAEWKLEINLRDMRVSMIRAQGGAASWERPTSP